ncbi:MAG: type I-C CRISPR-associated protein Cas5c [Limnochordia bacterium]|nr:type I-C CRISPR-associated protein Cas5c [Limnochordia bacterium]
MEAKEHVLEVWGELACFTRPELKVERFSYPIITPSAARGIYDAIFCKPSKDVSQAEFRWQITRIEALSFPSYIGLLRNEVQDVVSVSNVNSWIKGKQPKPLVADDTSGQRTQRQTMALKNVRYRLHARIVPWPAFRSRLPAFDAQFRRRAGQGKCFYQPYLGCREFPAYFRLVDQNEELQRSVPWNADLGFVLYDVFDLSQPGTGQSQPSISLFKAVVKDGVLEVPDYDDPAVLKGEKEEG